jgi:hypothetical protein
MGGCAATPPLEQDCKIHFTEEKEIAKCEKRVMARENIRFQRKQDELRKKACADVGGVWIVNGSRSACGTREDVQDILGGYGSRQQY